MYSVGIDVSKLKSTVSILDINGNVVKKPFDISHTVSDLSHLTDVIKSLDGKLKVVMEATGAYHLPILNFLQENEIFVAVVNPMIIQKYAAMSIRKKKTDPIDSMRIASYGVDYWNRLTEYTATSAVYSELRILSRQYLHYIMALKDAKINLTNLMDQVLPGMKPLLNSQTRTSGKNLLTDFVECFWHVNRITKMSQQKFIEAYAEWAKKKGHHVSETKAISLYTNAQNGVPTMSSSMPSTKMLVLEAVHALKNVERTLAVILSRMQELAKSLKEYSVVRAMSGVGDVLAPRIIAEVGDIRRFHSSKALVAYAGLDSPPCQSGNMNIDSRHISKRGAPTLRRTGYEIMQCMKIAQPQHDNAVYLFMLKKEAEGKPKKVAKIAALNKFLRIYYARVNSLYQ
jgi:transposase